MEGGVSMIGWWVLLKVPRSFNCELLLKKLKLLLMFDHLYITVKYVLENVEGRLFIQFARTKSGYGKIRKNTVAIFIKYCWCRANKKEVLRCCWKLEKVVSLVSSLFGCISQPSGDYHPDSTSPSIKYSFLNEVTKDTSEQSGKCDLSSKL